MGDDGGRVGLKRLEGQVKGNIHFKIQKYYNSVMGIQYVKRNYFTPLLFDSEFVSLISLYLFEITG